MILGTLLGDAWLAKVKKGKRKNSYLGVCHSVKQEEYLQHKYSILTEIGARKVSTRIQIKNDKKYTFNEFVTKSLPQLTELRKILYPKGKKKITKKYLDKLDSRSLAYWIMDDGSLVWHKRKRKKGVIYSTCEFMLAVNCFTVFEIELIQNWLKENYNIESKIQYHSSSKTFYLKINRINYQELIKHIKEFIIPSMYYKIDISKLGRLVETTTTPKI